MDQKDFVTALNGLIADIRKEGLSREALDFLGKCVRAYSSMAHVWNNYRDLELVGRLSPPPQRILDFGCGIGIQSYLLSRMGYRVTGLETIYDKSLEGFLKHNAQVHIGTRDDSMRTVWKIVKSRMPELEFEVYDGVNIPHAKDKFDAVFSYAVLEHIPKDDVPAIIKEIWRVLRPGGLFYVFQLPQVYSYTEFLARRLNIESHEFLWKPREIDNVLTKAQFEVIYRNRADMFFNHPHELINPFFPVIKVANEFLLSTPLSFFCHHLTVIGQKR